MWKCCRSWPLRVQGYHEPYSCSTPFTEEPEPSHCFSLYLTHLLREAWISRFWIRIVMVVFQYTSCRWSIIFARRVVERRARSDSTLYVLMSSSVPVQILRSAELSLQRWRACGWFPRDGNRWIAREAPLEWSQLHPVCSIWVWFGSLSCNGCS